MSKLLTDYLLKHSSKKESGLIITNTRIGDKDESIYGGTYHIPDSEYGEFIKLFFKEIINEEKKEYLTEKQIENGGPILIDIDLRYEYSVTKRIHNAKHVSDIVCLYLEELKSMFQFDNDTHIPVYICEKSDVNRVESKNITKDGIHMIIGLKANRNCQSILRKRVIAKIDTIWKDLPIINTWDDVFDEGITKGHTNWQLYGSRKPNNQPYCLKYVYDVCQDSNDGELMYNPVDINIIKTWENIFKMSARYQDNITLFMDNEFASECNEVTINRVQGSSNHVNHHMNAPDIKNKFDLNTGIEYFLESLKTDDFELREAYEYTMVLPKSYYESGSFSKWIRVGWALCNTSPRLFIVWIAFSANQSNFDFKEVNDLWGKWQTFDTNNINGLTKRSIMHWAREGNLNGYKKVLEDSIDYHIDKTLEHLSLTTSDKGGVNRGSGDFDIASVLFHLYKDEYVCASVKGNIWYQYANHKWCEIDSGTSLRKAISEVLRKIYLNKAIKMTELIATMAGQDEKVKMIKKRVDVILSICERLSRTNDKKNIMVEAKELFYNGNFTEKLDQNQYLLCFKNCVIDFKSKEIRQGRPEDFISKCTNINYIPLNSQKDTIIINEIEDFMKKLFPNPELHKYMWDHLTSTLIGTCREQTINMYIGVGQNGKSVLVNLMEQVLGEYKGDVPLSLITQQRTKIGGVAPELLQLKGCRLAVIQEPSKGDRINEGIMKQLTGGDPIQARGLYHNIMSSFIPQFKLVVCSNEFMDIQSQDHGTWRRIRVVDFEALFTERPVDTDTKKPYQYLLDKDIKEKFILWKEVLASMLVKNAFLTNGKVEDCEKVLKASNSYRESQDSIAEFLNTRICPHYNGSLSKIAVSEHFKEWFNSNYGGKAPNMKEISAQADKKFGNARDGVWIGYQMKPLNDLIEEEELVVVV
jgi:P4 family phage/plasmid primase-like protien